MSKSAIKTISTALEIISKAGVSLPHLANITDPAVRASWRNADHLACFMVRCLADCFEAETLETITQHEWDSMTTACQRYYESGLDLWNGKQWKETGHINAAEELQRLADMVARWVKYHAEQEHTAARARIAERELVKHIDQLRDAYEVAHRIAQETKNFRVSDNVYVDVPKGYTIKRVSDDKRHRIMVQAEGEEYTTVGEVLTHEANGDDVGGFVYEVRKELQPVLCSTELTALKSIIAALEGE